MQKVRLTGVIQHRTCVLAFLFAFMASASPQAMAEPTSGPLYIKTLRPYGGGSHVYVFVGEKSFCNADTFVIDVSVANGKEIYAAALTAYALGKPVRLEAASATGCAGWGTKLQSLYLDA